MQQAIFRDYEIQTENDSLINKIMEYQKKKSSQPRSNNQMFPGISTMNSTKSQAFREDPNKSLNWGMRKNFYQKIDHENKELLTRIAQ